MKQSTKPIKAELPTARPDERPVPLEAVLCSEELNRRVSRLPDYQTENRAFTTLAQALADAPSTILQELTHTILETFHADSAGISLLNEDGKSFYWAAIAGLWQPHIGGGMPRDFSPCGDVLDCNGPLLFSRFDRRYTYFNRVKPRCEECLLVPFYVQGKAVGTIWVIAHDRRKFDAEDLRQLESLGRFAAAAYQATQALDAALQHGRAAHRLGEDAVQSGQVMDSLDRELRASEERYRALFESIDEGFCIIEKVDGDAGSPLDFRCVEANPAFVLQSGLSGVVGRTLRQVFPDEFKEWLLTYETVLRTGQPIRLERGLIIQGRVLELHAFRVKDETHRRVGVSFTDITERKRAEETLRRSEGDLRDFVENASVGLHWVAADGIILWANQTELDLLGYPREEYIGHHIAEFHADQPVIEDILVRLTGGETLLDHEARLRCKDGSIRHVLINSNTLFENEKFVHTRCFTRDITEHKQADETLRQSEAFNRSIIESSPDCIKVLDLDGNLLSMLAGQELLGIEDIRPFLHKSWIEFWESGDRQVARATVAAAAAGQEGRFVGFFRTLRGEPKWWDVMISPMIDANGKPVRLLAISRDVTERRRAEMNLGFLASVSHDLLHLTGVEEIMRIVGAKVAAYLQLSLCAFVEVDEIAEQVVISHDWHRDDVPGLTGVHRLADFVEEELLRAARAEEVIVVRDTVTDPRTEPAKFAALKIAAFVCVPLLRDGHWRFALCLYHSAAYDWREDEIELIRELTARIWTRLERLRAKEALRQSEERYRQLFDGAPIAIYTCDATGIIQDYNRCAVELWGREPQQGDTDDWASDALKWYMPDGMPVAQEQSPMAVVLQGEIAAAHDLKAVIERPNGSRIDVIANIVSLKNTQGEITGAMNYFYDVTERSRLERKTLEQAEALAELDRRKDEFLAMLSHELRNPLAPISNATLLLRLQKNEDPIQRQARGVIERQVGQLKRLVDDLLEVSRINTGRVQLRPERIVLNGIVERALETAQPLVVQGGHELTVALPPYPIWLQADAARLEQVVVNLLTNAAKYTDAGGHIWLNVDVENEVAVLRVRDTGIGISADLLPRIFDLFTQAERSLDRSQGGLGIGLCLVQRLVDLHGGTVTADSVLGQGSEFVVRLPLLLDAQPLPSPSIKTAQPSAKCRRVLVVDDNMDSAQSLAALLTMSGHEVRTAYDGPTGLEAALDYRPDVMLLDIGLPGLDGFEVATQVRQQLALKNIVLVAITGYGQDTDRQRSQDAGFDHHLVKPADFDDVLKILETTV